ncbi:hypothetical protein TIFTF001_035955 [Ficus carica]|uniref:Uncharacterized protein n=1 Tax=Ficus carica TaxID=3494 RepID=A0AA88JAL9_FICCA|nr:hypothetical protein TIFTF001_035955 [Ficus carica]
MGGVRHGRECRRSAECGVGGERERESRVSSLVDPSENGGGRVSGGGGRRRMDPREKIER